MSGSTEAGSKHRPKSGCLFHKRVLQPRQQEFGVGKLHRRKLMLVTWERRLRSSYLPHLHLEAYELYLATKRLPGELGSMGVLLVRGVHWHALWPSKLTLKSQGSIPLLRSPMDTHHRACIKQRTTNLYLAGAATCRVCALRLAFKFVLVTVVLYTTMRRPSLPGQR